MTKLKAQTITKTTLILNAYSFVIYGPPTMWILLQAWESGVTQQKP